MFRIHCKIMRFKLVFMLQIQDALALVKHMSNNDQLNAENLWKEALEQLQQLIKETSENVSYISIYNNRFFYGTRIERKLDRHSFLPPFDS